MSILSKTCDPLNCERLERVKRWPGLRRAWSGRKVRIYSTEHGAYWRANGAGYSDTEAEAGIYDFEEAFNRTRHCDPSKGIQFYWVKGAAVSPQAQRSASDTLSVELGALCRPVSEQLSGHLLPDDARQFDSVAEAITTLYVLGYIGDNIAERCRHRLLKKLQPAVDRCRAARVQAGKEDASHG